MMRALFILVLRATSHSCNVRRGEDETPGWVDSVALTDQFCLRYSQLYSRRVHRSIHTVLHSARPLFAPARSAS